MQPLSDETQFALELARKSAKVSEDMLRSEIDDVRRERDRCVDALRQIYAEYGEYDRIAEICDPLIREFPN
jgi:flagellar biosynthesis chaperone FliJ